MITWSWPGDLGWLTKDKPYGFRLTEDEGKQFARLMQAMKRKNIRNVKLSKNELTHFDKNGNPSMVDVNQKDSTIRVAIATGKIIMKTNTLKKILDLEIKKGDVLNVAKLAGIMAAKKTDQLIPLCHSIPLSYVNVNLEPNIEESCVNITAEASLVGKTGVEMEALTAVSVAGLTIYDMCKAIDREMTSKALGFTNPMANSIDAVSSRDFIIEPLAAASILASHLSRFSEEIILWVSEGFDFIELPDSLATGSSIMPQKKNPDIAELVRGKNGRVIGALMSILVVMKGLPLAYSKDLQEDKELTFDAIDNILNSLEAINAIIKKLKPKKENLSSAAQKSYSTATDLADWLVSNLNIPFREAHKITGNVVRYCEKKKIKLSELTIKELKSFNKKIMVSAVQSASHDPIAIEKYFESWKQTVLETLKKVSKFEFEAIKNAVSQIKHEEVKPKIILADIGMVTETDVTLAKASNAVLIAFNVKPSKEAKKLAENEKIKISSYNIIYEVLDYIKQRMSGLLAPDVQETITGTAQILEIFKVSGAGKVAGSKVTEGEINSTSDVRIIRDGAIIYTGKVSSIFREKNQVKQVSGGQECGITVKDYMDFQKNDTIEAFSVTSTERSI